MNVDVLMEVDESREEWSAKEEQEALRRSGEDTSVEALDFKIGVQLRKLKRLIIDRNLEVDRINKRRNQYDEIINAQRIRKQEGRKIKRRSCTLIHHPEMIVERSVLEIHEQIFKELNGYLKKRKNMSAACLISMILYAVQFGGIEEALGGLFTALVVRNCMEAPSKLVRAVIALIAMKNDGGIVFKRTRKMVKDGLKELPNLYAYKEFAPTPSNVWIDKANFDIRVRDTYEDGKRCLGNYFWKTLFTKPIYVDTENAYKVLPHGSKTALVTFCDADMKTVLLWRIHKHTRKEVENMKKLMIELSKIRKFAAFGKEEFFDPIPLADFASGGTSLKSLAMSHGIEISKTETMSDWTAEELRDDQMHVSKTNDEETKKKQKKVLLLKCIVHSIASVSSSFSNAIFSTATCSTVIGHSGASVPMFIPAFRHQLLNGGISQMISLVD
ncbi:hypothetical protein L5515_019480 [Caenorhabditis briggsae]|uniref:Uncharacterized protein n=1 Tax=Caenorhabditis briggsae TaxID=6238 RepID=A0AAE9JTT7_CAEBR|nr:hypothetical protein L5515_019480 [Caenorhabditis briggsae]